MQNWFFIKTLSESSVKAGLGSKAIIFNLKGLPPTQKQIDAIPKQASIIGSWLMWLSILLTLLAAIVAYLGIQELFSTISHLDQLMFAPGRPMRGGGLSIFSHMRYLTAVKVFAFSSTVTFWLGVLMFVVAWYLRQELTPLLTAATQGLILNYQGKSIDDAYVQLVCRQGRMPTRLEERMMLAEIEREEESRLLQDIVRGDRSSVRVSDNGEKRGEPEKAFTAFD